MARDWIHTEMMSVWSCMGTKKCVMVFEKAVTRMVRGSGASRHQHFNFKWVTNRGRRDMRPPYSPAPPSHLLSNRSWRLHIRLIVPEVRSIPPHHATVASVELIGTRSRSSTPNHCSTVGRLPLESEKVVHLRNPGRATVGVAVAP